MVEYVVSFLIVFAITLLFISDDAWSKIARSISRFGRRKP